MRTIRQVDKVVAFLAFSVSALGSAAVPARAAPEPTPTYTMAESVNLALTKGPDIQQAQLNREIAAQQFTQAKSKAGINVSASASAKHADDLYQTVVPPDDTALGTNTAQGTLSLTGPLTTATLNVQESLAESNRVLSQASGPENLTTASLSLSQTVWDGYSGGKFSGTLEQAHIALQKADLSFQTAKSTITHNTETAFLAVVSAEQIVALRTASLAEREKELQRTSVLAENGNATNLDIEQAQINRATARTDLNSAQNALRAARMDLAVKMGQDPNLDFMVVAPTLESDPPPALDKAVATALENRADLAQLELDIESGSIAVALARADGSPTVSVNGGMTLSRDWTATTTGLQWSAGAQISLPVADSGYQRSRIQSAVDQQQLAARKVAALELAIASTIQGDLDDIATKAAEIDIASMSVDVAKGKLTIAETGIETGQSSQLDVLTASVAVTSAQVDLINAHTSLQTARLMLRQDMGL